MQHEFIIPKLYLFFLLIYFRKLNKEAVLRDFAEILLDYGRLMERPAESYSTSKTTSNTNHSSNGTTNGTIA